MIRELSKNFGAYNIGHIIKVAVEFYGKTDDIVLSDQQEAMLKGEYPDGKVPANVTYTKDATVAEEITP